MNQKVFNEIVNAPNIEVAVAIFMKSLVDDVRRSEQKKAARLRRQRERTIQVPDQATTRLRNLVVTNIRTEGLAPQFKARVEGLLEDSGERASIYLMESGFYGPLNIFGKKRNLR